MVVVVVVGSAVVVVVGCSGRCSSCQGSAVVVVVVVVVWCSCSRCLLVLQSSLSTGALLVFKFSSFHNSYPGCQVKPSGAEIPLDDIFAPKMFFLTVNSTFASRFDHSLLHQLPDEQPEFRTFKWSTSFSSTFLHFNAKFVTDTFTTSDLNIYFTFLSRKVFCCHLRDSRCILKFVRRLYSFTVSNFATYSTAK